MERYSTTQVAERSGATYRQLDYWARNGVLEGSVTLGNGSGSRHVYSAADVERARVVAAVSQLGATSPILAALVEHLSGDDLHSWPLLLFVLVDGTVSETIVPGVACYVVDVGGLCAAGFGRHRVRAPAA
jgi:DNA-binding transcriptional MerR regulator